MRVIAATGGLALAAVAGVTLFVTMRPGAPGPPSLASAQLQATSTGATLAFPDGLFPPLAAASPNPAPAKPVTSNPAPSKPVTRPVSAPRPPSAPSIVVRSTQQTLINGDRSAYHLGSLTWSSCLANVARYEAAKLATPGVNFQHYDGVSRDLTCHLGRQVGENIGWYSGGINDAKLNSMFMASPEHKANILGPYHYVATAWAVRSDGTAFITVEFG